MQEAMVTFQLLHNKGIAEEMAEVLQRHGIDADIVPNKQYFDPSFAFNKTDPEINLKLRPADFTRAREVLGHWYEARADEVEDHYYLFRFSDNELLEIIRQPDEWGIFDLVLAKRILAQRGIAIPGIAEQQAMAARIREQEKPETIGRGWIIFGYALSLLGGFFGIMMGWLLSTLRKTTLDGNRVPVYDDHIRKHGRNMMAVGVFVFAAFMIWKMAGTL